MKPLLFTKKEPARVLLIVERQLSALADGKQYSLEIKEYRKKRSMDANAYAWVLLDKIAAEMGINKVALYREAITHIGGNNAIVCVKNEAAESLRMAWAQKGLGWVADTLPSKIEGCTNVILYYGSSVYDGKQMARLIDNLVQDAKALGIETLSPNEIARMEAAWDAQSNKGDRHSGGGKGGCAGA